MTQSHHIPPGLVKEKVWHAASPTSSSISGPPVKQPSASKCLDNSWNTLTGDTWGWAKSFGTIITYYYYHFGGEEWTTNLFYCSMVLLRASLVSTRVSGLWLPVWLKITSRHRQYRIRSLSRLIAFPCFSRRFICTLITLITLHTSLLISPETPPSQQRCVLCLHSSQLSTRETCCPGPKLPEIETKWNKSKQRANSNGLKQWFSLSGEPEMISDIRFANFCKNIWYTVYE